MAFTFPLLLKTPDGVVFLVCDRGQINGDKVNEADLIEWGKKFLSEDKTFVDIGAHMGTYALTYSKLSRNVVAFEPWPRNFYQLCGSIVASKVNNVVAYKVALGDAEGTGVMSICSEDGGNATLLDMKVAIDEKKVEVKTLDSYELTGVGFIKIDVEGMENEVLIGGKNTLVRNSLPPVLVESWVEKADKRNSLISFMTGIGYEVFPINEYPHMLICLKKGTMEKSSSEKKEEKNE